MGVGCVDPGRVGDEVLDTSLRMGFVSAVLRIGRQMG
jgi:hypothetical protein